MGELDIYMSNGNRESLLEKKRNRKRHLYDLIQNKTTVLKSNLPLWASYILNIFREPFF